MEHADFCQSCCMPLDNDTMLGTEKDGSKSQQYCKYCYQDGSFVNPSMTLEGMTKLVRTKMQEMNLDQGIIATTVKNLPYLNRWTGVKSSV
jgi:hypothetical protein